MLISGVASQGGSFWLHYEYAPPRPIPWERGRLAIWYRTPPPESPGIAPILSCALSSPLPLAAWQSRRSPPNRVSRGLFALISESILRFTHPSPLRSRFSLCGAQIDAVPKKLGLLWGPISVSSSVSSSSLFSASCDECCSVWKVRGIFRFGDGEV